MRELYENYFAVRGSKIISLYGRYALNWLR